MYFTDRGIEELDKRRGDEEVTLAWLADQLQEFVDHAPGVRDADRAASPPGWPASTTPRTEPPGIRSVVGVAPAARRTDSRISKTSVPKRADRAGHVAAPRR